MAVLATTVAYDCKLVSCSSVNTLTKSFLSITGTLSIGLARFTDQGRVVQSPIKLTQD